MPPKTADVGTQTDAVTVQRIATQYEPQPEVESNNVEADDDDPMDPDYVPDYEEMLDEGATDDTEEDQEIRM